MLEPGFYPHSPAAVELRETHISWVFLAGELAYKVKKPLTLPFLDYGSLERRHQMCREEVRLNRRFAPRIYRRVVAVVRDGDGWALASEDDPAAVEYAVEMRRVEEHRSIAALISADALERRQVLAVARRVADQHAEAPIAPPGPAPRRAPDRDPGGEHRDAARRRRFGPRPASLDSAERFTRAFVTARRERLERRASAGLVRDCHGDLRAEHVIVPERGEVYIYDCIEFDPSLRQIDVAADIAFLVMDLAALGAEDHAWALADAYRQAGGDPGDDATLSFFAAYRAWVRTKVDCLRADELSADNPEREVQERKARDRLELGHRFAWRARRPLVLALGGVAASGKTTLALELARLSGWEHVSSDLTRKRLAGLEPQQRAAPEHYSREFTLRTYRELGIAARAELERSRGVIVDATFHRGDERGAFLAGLGARREPILFVVCRASEEALLTRAHVRRLEPGRVSDADPMVVTRQLAEFEPLREIAREDRAELVTEAAPRELVTELEALVDERVWRRAANRAEV